MTTTTTGTTPLPLRDSADIQGDIIAGFKKDYVSLLFLQFEDRARAQAWLAALAPRIATTKQVARFNKKFSDARKTSGGDDPEALKATWLGVSFTHAGIQFVSGQPVPVPDTPKDSTLRAFVLGASARAMDLGDVRDSASECWLFGHDGGRTVHAVLTIASDSPEDLQIAIDEQREVATRAAAVIVFQQNAATLTGDRRGKEHFGFKDGISEPGVLGFDEEDPQRKGYVKGHPGTRLIPPGEFLVGRPRVEVEGDRREYPTKDMPPWMTDGSFQVIRRLGQDVPGWWAQVGEQLEELKKVKDAVPEGATVEWLAARMVGRWRSGAPVHKCPTHDPVNDAAAMRDNDISFLDDPDGLKTPLFSHLRQTAPRDGLVDEGPVAEVFMDARRIMRRGAPYGQPFDPTTGSAGGPDASRGLLFVSYQSDLVEQFEFIQKDWINTPNFPPGRGDRKPGPDGMISGRLPKINEGVLQYESTNAEGPRTTPLSMRRFVRTEGAVYAFAPSISTLKALAQGRLDGHTPTSARVDAFLPVADQQRFGGVSQFWMFQQDKVRTIAVPDSRETTDMVLRPTSDLTGWPALENVARLDALLPVADLQRIDGRSSYWLFHTRNGKQVFRMISIADGPRYTSKVEVADRELTPWRSFSGVAHVDAVLPVPDQQRVGGKSGYWVFHTVTGTDGRERQVYRMITITDGPRRADELVRSDRELTLWESLRGVDRVDAFLPVPTMQRAAGKSQFWVFHRQGVRTVSIADGERHTDTRVRDDRPLGEWVNLG
ncbi:Dyp-type peroxidase [Streptacidiphilus sp. MAP5-3]|uniref:Dyp-type peroxidase n=1 Tax=unclassified Streptacidiphilus TaxID=2643834 RepID=UPI00351586BE